MREPPGVRFSISLLQSFLLLTRCGVRPVHARACVQEPLDQPVPVGGRCHHDPLAVVVGRRDCSENLAPLLAHPLLVEAALFLVDDHPYTSVCVQLNSGIEFPRGFLLSGGEDEFRLVTILLLYCPVEEPSR